MPTGIAIALPPGYAAFVHPRSGLALKHGLSVVNTPGHHRLRLSRRDRGTAGQSRPPRAHLDLARRPHRPARRPEGRAGGLRRGRRAARVRARCGRLRVHRWPRGRRPRPRGRLMATPQGRGRASRTSRRKLETPRRPVDVRAERAVGRHREGRRRRSRLPRLRLAAHPRASGVQPADADRRRRGHHRLGRAGHRGLRPRAPRLRRRPLRRVVGRRAGRPRDRGRATRRRRPSRSTDRSAPSCASRCR